MAQGKRWTITLIFGVASLAVLAGSNALGNPFSAIGENMHVYLAGGMSVRYDDNIYLSRMNTRSDIITTVSPAVQFEYGGTDTPNRGQITLRKDYVFYLSNPENNTDLWAMNANLDLMGSRSSVSLAVAVTPSDSNSRDALGFGRLVRSTTYSASVDAVYNITGKTRLSGGVTYSATEYRTDGYSDQSSVTVPVRVLYEVTAKTDLRAGYTYRATFLSDFPDQNSQDHTVSVGTTREITPTLSGNLDIGVTRRTLSNGDSGTIIPVDGTLTWVATPRMVYSAIARRDFGNSAIGGTNFLQTMVGLNVSYAFAERWNGSAGVTYELAEYHEIDRVDHYWTANLGLNYSPHRYVSMSAGYVFRANQSTIDLAEFNSNVLSFSANVRY